MAQWKTVLMRVIVMSALVLTPVLWGALAQTAPTARKTITTEAEFHQVMNDLSN